MIPARILAPFSRRHRGDRASRHARVRRQDRQQGCGLRRLDKITGRIISFDVYIDETVRFGALQVTPRVCYDRPPTEEPQTDAFVEVDEIGHDRKVSRIFTGWMFAASPGLHAVDNAVYDVWLTDCKMTSDVPPPKT